MAITKATIMADAIARTNRTEVISIDTFLKAILYDISTRGPFLEKTGSVTVLINTSSIALPTDFRSILSVIDASDNVLTPIPSLPVYLALVDNSSATGTPIQYIIFNEKIYVYPKAVAAAILTLWYRYYANDVNAIALPDHFQEAITEGVCWKIYEAVGEGATNGAVHQANYNAELAKLTIRYAQYRNNHAGVMEPANLPG
jgi:hypothetical protein